MLRFGQIFMRNCSSWEMTDPLQCGPVVGVLSTEALSISFPSVPAFLLAVMCAPLLTWFSFPWRTPSRQRKAQSYVGNPGNPDCWVTLPWPTSSPWPGRFAGTSLPSVCFVFSDSPTAPFLSLGRFPTSPTQTLTQALCNFFSPSAHNTLIFQAVSSVGKVDNRHPLIQTATVSAESVHFAQRWVLPQGRLRIRN